MANDGEDEIFCGNISPKVNEAIIYELFMQAGPIASLNLPKRDNEHRGFAFIRYKHGCSIQYAVNLLAGTKLDGKTLTIRNNAKGVKGRSSEQEKNIYDVLDVSDYVPFGPLPIQVPPQMQMPLPLFMPSMLPNQGYPIHQPPYGTNNFPNHDRRNDFHGTPYQRNHGGFDRSRNDQHSNRHDHSNRGHYSDRRHNDHNDHHSDRHSGKHSNSRKGNRSFHN